MTSVPHIGSASASASARAGAGPADVPLIPHFPTSISQYFSKKWPVPHKPVQNKRRPKLQKKSPDVAQTLMPFAKFKNTNSRPPTQPYTLFPKDHLFNWFARLPISTVAVTSDSRNVHWKLSRRRQKHTLCLFSKMQTYVPFMLGE